MSSLINKLRRIVEQALEVTPVEVADRMNRPSGGEPGIYHPNTGAHCLLTDDGGIDLSSNANTHMLLQQGTIDLKASGIALDASHIHMHGQQWYGYQRFDPLLQWYSRPGDPTWVTRCAPLVANTPTSLATVILTGDPTKPVPIPLIALVHPQLLFGPNEAYLILTTSFADVLSELAEITL